MTKEHTMPDKKRTNPAWWKEAVVYIVYPKSFKDSDGDGIGDLRGIIEKIDYLKGLGVTCVWIAPFYKSPMVDNGYDISDYDSIGDQFGTFADFDELVTKLHAAGIKLMFDIVVNHTSIEHPWFVESRSSRDNPKRDWYIWRDGKDGQDGKEPNNWAASFGGSAWTLDPTTGQYYLHLFAVEQPDLNWRNPEVKREVFAMMRRWLLRGVDSFRMDMASVLYKPADFPDAVRLPGDNGLFVKGETVFSHNAELLPLFEDLRREVLDPYGAVLFAEMHELTPEIGLSYVGYANNRLHLVYQNHIIHSRGDWTAARKSVRTWAEAFQDRGWTTTTFSNHDSPRPVSVYGDTSTEEMRKASAKLIATFFLTAPGTPFFYQGEEIGMTNVAFGSINDYNDPDTVGHYEERIAGGEDPATVFKDVMKMSRDNSRTPMQWDGQANAGFTTGKPWLGVNPNYEQINVARSEGDPESILEYYRALIALRKRTKALVYGDYVPLSDDADEVYLYKRVFGNKEVLVVLNCSPRAQSALLGVNLSEKHKLLLTNYLDTSRESKSESAKDTVVLQPWESRIYAI